MKNTLPFLLLIALALGCSKFGANTTTTSSNGGSNANADPAPAKPVKIVDLPATFNKTKDEIKAIVGGSPKNETPWLEYDLPLAHLTFMFDKAGKSNHCSFRFNPVSIGSATVSGTDTAEQLATMAGIDITGKTLDNATLADTFEQDLNGKKASIAIYHAGGKFDNIIITPDIMSNIKPK